MAYNYNRGGQSSQSFKGKKPVWMESENSNDSFVNPYNFISLETKSNKRKFNFDELNNSKNLLTGWIDYEIETKTPIFIPNTTNDNVFNHFDSEGNKLKSYDFFSYEDLADDKDRKGKYATPIIPGSEIRGVIRSAFEVITNSCMSTIDEDRILYKRTSFPKNPGILMKKDGKWVIQKAERVMLKVKQCNHDPVKQFNINDYEEGQEVYIKRSNVKYKNNSYMSYTVERLSTEYYSDGEKGYIHKGEDFSRKHHESVFIPQQNKKEIEINDEVVERLNKVKELYEGSYKQFKINENRTLIYYSDDFQYLSPACITKEVFKNTINRIIKNQGGYNPCDTTSSICPSCTLFGTIIRNDNAIASRVRFEDAKPTSEKDNKDYYLEEIILAELASPKISATEFYLERPKQAALWNYDYAEMYEGKYIKKIDYYQPKIRGRKFYWHSDQIEGISYFKANAENLKNSKIYNIRNVVIRPIKKELHFGGRIFFNQVKREELLQLLWVLNLGYNNSGNCHKIGMGKPLGLGSIKVKVIGVNFRQVKIDDNMIKYNIDTQKIEEIDLKQADIISEDSRSYKEFMKITDFNNRPQNIRYPISEDKRDIATYLWFVANKAVNPNDKNINFGVTNMRIYKELPKINEDNNKNKLPKYIKK